MTPDLTYLAWTAVLLALLWVPYFLGLTIEHGFPKPHFYRDPSLPRLPLWVQRANRAHINLVQAFAPFAALVLIAQVAGQANESTAMWRWPSSGAGSGTLSSISSASPTSAPSSS